MPTTATTEAVPAQYDEGILIAHPAYVMHFLDVDVMVQRSVIDGKVLVTVDGDDRHTRIDLNDGTVWNGPGGPVHTTPEAQQAAEAWKAAPPGLTVAMLEHLYDAQGVCWPISGDRTALALPWRIGRHAA